MTALPALHRDDALGLVVLSTATYDREVARREAAESALRALIDEQELYEGCTDPHEYWARWRRLRERLTAWHEGWGNG